MDLWPNLLQEKNQKETCEQNYMLFLFKTFLKN